jgi:beta-carotene hydroxylase
MNKRKIAYPTIILTLIAFAFYFASIFLAVYSIVPLYFSVIINTIMTYILFTSMHEAGHYNISGGLKKYRWLDEVIGWTSALTLFAPFYLFKNIHFRHHAYTNHPEKDPDHWLASKNIVSLIFHSATVFPAYFYNGLKILLTEKKLSKSIKKEFQIAFVVLCFMIASFIVLAMLYSVEFIFLLWVLPAIISQMFLAISFDWLPHHPHTSRDKYLGSRVFDIPFLSIFLLSQNYHLIHHLNPSIPFYDYRKTYKTMESEILEQGTNVISFSKSNS